MSQGKAQPQKNDSIQVIILAGSPMSARSPLMEKRPLAFWPLLDQTVLDQLLKALYQEGIKKAFVCGSQTLQKNKNQLRIPSGMKIDFLAETLPQGSAGALRQGALQSDPGLLLVVQVGLIWPGGLAEMVRDHCQTGSEMTLVLQPLEGPRKADTHETSGIFLCDSSIAERIPPVGYCDIKETLIPDLLQAGRKVSAFRADKPIGSFYDEWGYLQVVMDMFKDDAVKQKKETIRQDHYAELMDIYPNTKIARNVRIKGSVRIGTGTTVSEGTLLQGPLVIGSNVHIGRDCFITESVIWDQARLGDRTELQGCLVLEQAKVPGDLRIHDEIWTACGSARRKQKAASRRRDKAHSDLVFYQPVSEKNNYQGITLGSFCRNHRAAAILSVASAATVFAWTYWATLCNLRQIWMQSDEYSIGLLVPFLAGFILYSKRDQLSDYRVDPAISGLVILLLAQGLRLFGLFFLFDSAIRLSMVLSLGALVITIFGWRFFYRTIWIWAFLLLILPLPRRFEAMITMPLQNWATTSAVFLLEMIGYQVTQQGNIIHLGDTVVAVAEACNGLRMVTAFFVVIGFVALWLQRQWWENLVLVISALPIALLCNTLRLAMTAMAFTWLPGDHWHQVFHDFGGYAMMPLALICVVFELWVFRKLVISTESKPPEVMIVPKNKNENKGIIRNIE